jgi:hypothetical protein
MPQPTTREYLRHGPGTVAPGDAFRVPDITGRERPWGKPSTTRCRPLLACQHGGQIPEFGLHIGGIGDSIRNFPAKEVAIPLAKPVNLNVTYQGSVCGPKVKDDRDDRNCTSRR